MRRHSRIIETIPSERAPRSEGMGLRGRSSKKRGFKSITYTFDFATAGHGWSFVYDPGLLVSWESGDGSPAPGCVKITTTTNELVAAFQLHAPDLTYEELGVPAGARVFQLSTAAKYRYAANASVLVPTYFQFYGPTIVFSGLTSLGVSSWTDITTWSTTLPTAIGTPAGVPSTDELDFFLYGETQTDISGTNLDLRLDTFAVTIYYREAVPATNVKVKRTVTEAMQAHLDCSCVTLAACVKITRTDGTVFAFTTHDNDLVVSGVTYESRSNIELSALRNEIGGGIDNLEMAGVFASDEIAEGELRAGLYDNAAVELFLCNWNDLTQGTIVLLRGNVGAVKMGVGGYSLSIRSLSQRLHQQIGELTSPTCRVKALGDARCAPGGQFADGQTISNYTFARTVATVTDRRTFTISGDTHATGYFNYGKITFTSGANNNISREIKEHIYSGGVTTIKLHEELPYNLVASVTCSLVAGCDRRIETCIGSFANAKNFRGEPHLPGNDKLLKIGRP